MLTGEYSSETDLSGCEESGTRQGDYCNAVQLRLQRIPHEALYMEWPFRIVPNLVKGPGLWTPTSANLLLTPGKMNNLEWGSFLRLKWFTERNTAVISYQDYMFGSWRMGASRLERGSGWNITESATWSLITFLKPHLFQEPNARLLNSHWAVGTFWSNYIFTFIWLICKLDYCPLIFWLLGFIFFSFSSLC